MPVRRVLAVIPSHNEEEALPAVIASLREAAASLPWQLEAVVVDDGSTDSTASRARSLGVRVVRLCRNLGIGGAMQVGLRLAHQGGFDCAVQVDGDGQHPPAELARLVARLDEDPAPDLVVGSRFRERSGFRSTAMRRLGIRWFSLLLRALCRLRVTDPTSGFRAYGPRALALFDRSFPYDYPEPEALALAHLSGLRIVEEPVAMLERQGGRSSIRGVLTSSYYVLKVTVAMLLAVGRARLRED
jgi:glycosyltransferase involved in cell wall biosynthesis